MVYISTHALFLSYGTSAILHFRPTNTFFLDVRIYYTFHLLTRGFLVVRIEHGAAPGPLPCPNRGVWPRNSLNPA